MSEFTCGNCVNNDDGLCDFIGILVGDDDSPHCSYGKGWTSFDNFTKKRTKEEGRGHDD